MAQGLNLTKNEKFSGCTFNSDNLDFDKLDQGG